MNKPSKGSMTAYALILVLLCGMLISRFSVTSLNFALVNRLCLAEQQAQQGAESGLEICLRLATNSFYIVGAPPASYVVDLNFAHLASMTIFYEVATNAFGRLQASATAIVYDRALVPLARRTVTNEVEVEQPLPVNNKRFKRQWQPQ